MHAFDYGGAENFRGMRVLVYGNGISGHEIASDLASCTHVISAYRKPRYVLQKVVDGVPSDWQWYTQIGALRRASMAPQDFDRMLRERVVRVAGNPADFGAPEPDKSILVAGQSLCQDYLNQVRAGEILCRPEIASVDGRRVTFVDGTHEDVDAIVSATVTGWTSRTCRDEVWSRVGPELRLHNRTFHPDLPGLGVIGQFALQGPYLPLLELQARWITGVWSGEIPAPDESAMRVSVASAPPAVDSHHMLALTLAACGRCDARPARPARACRGTAVRAAAAAAVSPRRPRGDAGRRRAATRPTRRHSTRPDRARRSCRLARTGSC